MIPSSAQLTLLVLLQVDELFIADASLTQATFYIGVFAQAVNDFGIAQYRLQGWAGWAPVHPVPGDHGELLTSVPSAGAVQLSFTESSTVYPPVVYQTFWKKKAGNGIGALVLRRGFTLRCSDSAVMYTPCGLEKAERAQPFIASGERTISTTVSVRSACLLGLLLLSPGESRA